jgi:hypothetical protein
MTTPEQPADPTERPETAREEAQVHEVDTVEVVETNQPTDAWGED